MKLIKFFFLIFVFYLLACQHKTEQKQLEKNLIINHIDLYPQYPDCPEFYDQEKQLNCLSKKFNNLILYKIESQYKDEFKIFKDTIWVTFKIDTLGQTKFINFIHLNDTVHNEQKYINIFNNIVRFIPKIKPAIYQGQSVDFQFKTPIIYKNFNKKIEK